MANSFVQVPPDSTGKLIDTWTTTVLGYHRQGIVISDPSTDANVVGISSRLRVPIETEQLLDYDTGGGTANLSLVGLALPGAGGPVAGGTVTNPIVVSGTVAATGGLTDAELRATAVPISVATLPLPTGAATEATLATHLTEADFDTKIGSLTEAAPATDTASSGLNGRLQRIAQRITSLITALGSPFQSGGSIGNTTFASTVADGANVVEGVTTGAKVITDANGTLQQYLRGLVYLLITAANYPEKAFYGTAQTCISTAVDIASGNFSGAPAATFDNTTDAAVDALQRRTITINLEGVQKVDFYIKNSTAQNMNNDGGTSCIVKITPLAYGVAV